MIERRCCTGFMEEPGLFIRCSSEVMGKEFKCDISIQLRVVGFVDHAHTALTKLFENLVV
jgi:hypothetical protein